MKQFYIEHLLRFAIVLSFVFNLDFESFGQKNEYSFDKNYKIPGAFKSFQNIQSSATSLKYSKDEGDWDTNFSVPGIIGTIHATASDNENFYVGGEFSVAGSITANSIVKWDGNRWHSIGEGEENGIPQDEFSGEHSVLAIASYDGKLFVGGNFVRAGTRDVNGIAFWDGKKWNRMGNGKHNGIRNITVIGKDTIYHAGSVYSLFVHKDRLYVGGSFQMAGKNLTNGVAVWNIRENKWESIRGGFKYSNQIPTYVYGFAKYKDQVLAAGTFDVPGDIKASNIASWDGESWSAVGEYPEGIIDIKSDNSGKIFVVCDMSDKDSTDHCGISVWNGNNWQKIKGPDGYKTTVSGLYHLNNVLFASGKFIDKNGKCSVLAKLDDEGWQIIEGPEISNNQQMNALVKGIEYVKGKYYMAGDFTKAGDDYVANVAEWDAESLDWSELNDGNSNNGIYDGTILTVEKNGRDIYAGGSFTIAGGTNANNIARWNGEKWEALGEGTQNGINGFVLSILPTDTRVFAGGYFNKAGSSEAFHVAEWDGEKWLPLGIGVGGIHGAHVRDLALSGDYLYVAGYFSVVGDDKNPALPANSIARFNLTTRKWESIGKGIGSNDGQPGRIYDMEVYHNMIVLGGEFSSADALPATNFAVLEGETFSVLPNSGISGLINAVEIVNEEIFIGGQLQPPDNNDTVGILKWGGTGWTEINGRLKSEKGLVLIADIEPFRSGFIAGGYFKYAGDKEVNNIAYYDGSEWSDIGGGLEPGVTDFIIAGDKLYVAGSPVISSPLGNAIGLAEYVFEDVSTGRTDLPGKPALISNYPNPFSNSSVISYLLESSVPVEISIFDQTGRQIKVLVNEYKEPGNYTVILNADEFSEGVYLCRFKYGNFSETIKMLVTHQ